MASNNKRAALSKRLWGKLRELGGPELDLENDPLGARYEVNKYGIIVNTDTFDEIKDVFDRLLALLTVEGWTIKRRGSDFYVSRHEFDDAVGAFHEPADHNGYCPGYNMHIGVF
jgi:hypothetical protein